MGFANEVAFNFLNKNPAQPTVISALPISFVQPLLRGGGRAVVLEPLTQARAKSALRGPYLRAVSPAVLRDDDDRRHDSELRSRDSTCKVSRPRATATRPRASFRSFSTWSKSKSIEETCFFWKASLNYIKS